MRGRRRRPTPICSAHLHKWSKNKFHSQLNCAAAAGTDDGVGGGDVGSGATATEASRRRIVESETVLTAVRIGEVGMVENVKELGPELSVEALGEVPILRHRKVDILETGIRERISAHVAKLSESGRDHHGVAFGIAAEKINCSCSRSWVPAIQCQSFAGASR